MVRKQTYQIRVILFKGFSLHHRLTDEIIINLVIWVIEIVIIIHCLDHIGIPVELGANGQSGPLCESFLFADSRLKDG